VCSGDITRTTAAELDSSASLAPRLAAHTLEALARHNAVVAATLRGLSNDVYFTVGLITKTWADLMLEAVSELALDEPAFRQSLPPGFANRDFD
jgi:hypothetical protein